MLLIEPLDKGSSPSPFLNDGWLSQGLSYGILGIPNMNSANRHIVFCKGTWSSLFSAFDNLEMGMRFKIALFLSADSASCDQKQDDRDNEKTIHHNGSFATPCKEYT